MKRFNVKLLLILLGAATALGLGLFGLNRFQVNRNAGGIVKLARQKLEQDKTAEALSLFTRYLGMRPQDASVHAEYARLLLERATAIDATQADLTRAYNALEEAVRRNPEDDGLRKKLAEFQLRVGRYSDAREHLEVLEEHLDRRSAEGSAPPPAAKTKDAVAGETVDRSSLELLLARSYAGDGDFDRAGRLVGDLVGYDVQARRFDPNRDPTDSTDPYILLATILQERLRDDAAADEVLRKLVERRGDDPQAWLALSRWHRQQGDLDAASREIDKAVAIAPEDANVLFGAFEVALAKQDMDGAEKVAKRARELFAADERVYRGLASIALQRNDLATAEQVLRDGIAELPGKASLLLMFADTLLQRGNIDEVDQVIKRIEDLYGSTSPAVGLLQARLLIGRRQWPQAKQRLETIRPLAAGITELTKQIDLCLAQCFENLGEFDEQLDVSRRLLIDDPTSLAARVGAAAALAAAGRVPEALQEFELVASSLPEDRLATIPQVWYPLLQLRLVEQLKRPVADRDWSRIDELIGMLEQSTAVSADQLALLRADVLSRKGESDAALELLERATQAADASPQVLSALATLTLRARGVKAAREVLARMPESQRSNLGLLALRAQMAARESGTAELAEIEGLADSLAPPEAASLLSTLAGLRLEMGAVPEAERLWRAAAARQPDDLQSRSALLELAIRSGDLPMAKAAADDVEKVAGPTSARSKVAQAAANILEVRLAQRSQELNSGRIELSAEEVEKLNKARNMLIEAENDRPGWQQIQVYFAELEGLRGNAPAAIDHLQKALRLAPGNVPIVRQLVALLFASNRLDEARKALESLGPEGVAGFERLTAEMELRSGRLDEAVALAERSVSLDSRDVNELLWLGQLLERSGKPERATEFVRRAVDVAPEKPEPWLTLFGLELATGKRKAAERTLDKAVEALAPPASHLVRAQGAELLGRIEDADRALAAAVESAPGDVGIARTRAEFLIRAGRSPAACDLLRTIIDSQVEGATDKSTQAWARRRLAGLIAERGSYRSLREALEILEGNTEDGSLPADDAAAKIALLGNRPEPESWREAIETIERLRDLQPLTTGQRLTLAGLLDKVGRWQECREEMMSIVAAPNTPPAFIAILVDKLINHDELAGARTWLKRLQNQAPEAPVTVALEARLAVAEEDRPRAVEAARRLMPAREIPPDQVTQLAALARLLEDMKFDKAADKVLAQYASMSTDGVIARAEFLGRQKRPSEALDVLDAARNSLSLERLLSTAVNAVRSAGADDTAAVDRLAQWLSKGRRVDPDSVVIGLLEAELKVVQGRPAEAEAIYRGLMARKDVPPTQAAVIANNLAFHLATPPTAAEALKLIDEAIATLGPHPDLLDTRGVVRLALGENEQAIADLQQANLQPTGAKLLHLAYAHLRAGDKSLARETLEAGRKKGLGTEALSGPDVERLRELEKALGLQPSQAGPDQPASPSRDAAAVAGGRRLAA